MAHPPTVPPPGDIELAKRLVRWLVAGCPRPEPQRAPVFRDPAVEKNFRGWQRGLYLRSAAALRSEPLIDGVLDPDYREWVA